MKTCDQRLRNFATLASWPTPTTKDHKDGDEQSCKNVPVNALLGRTAVLAGSWMTPWAQDSYERSNWKTIERAQVGEAQQTLVRQARGQLASWKTPNAPRAHDSDNTAGRGYASKKQKDLPDQVVSVVGGETLSGSSAPTRSTGQLNPAHSRWLMGLPREWDDCGVTAMQSLRPLRKRS